MNLKKILSVLVAMTVVGGMISCGGKTSQKEDPLKAHDALMKQVDRSLDESEE